MWQAGGSREWPSVMLLPIGVGSHSDDRTAQRWAASGSRLLAKLFGRSGRLVSDAVAQVITFQSGSPPILGLLELLVPEVLKTQRYAEIFSSQELDDRLQVILLLSGNSDLAILQLALNV